MLAVVIAGASAEAMRQLGRSANPRAAFDSVRSPATTIDADRNGDVQGWQHELRELWLKGQKQHPGSPPSSTERIDKGQKSGDSTSGAEEEDPGISLNLWFYHAATQPGGQRSVATYVPPHSAAYAPAGAPTQAGNAGRLPSLQLRADARNSSRTLLAATLWTNKGRHVALVSGPLSTAVPSFQWVHLAVVVRPRLAQIYVSSALLYLVPFKSLEFLHVHPSYMAQTEVCWLHAIRRCSLRHWLQVNGHMTAHSSSLSDSTEHFIVVPDVPKRLLPDLEMVRPGSQSVVYENVSYAIGKPPIRAGISTRGARGMVERMSIYGRPLVPGEVRWLATCSGVNSISGEHSPWLPTAPHPFLLRVSQGVCLSPWLS